MFRVSLLLWLVALAALNLFLLKHCETLIEIVPAFAGLIVLVPLFGFFALSAHAALSGRFCFALVRRQVRERFADSAAVVSGVFLALATSACLLLPGVFLRLMDLLFSPVERGIGVLSLPPETERFVFWLLLEALVSGPLVLLTLTFTWVHSRFRLEVTRRATVGESTGP
jgi:hypothetical protein